MLAPFVALITLAFLLAAPPLLGQTSPEVARRDLLNRAEAARAAGDHAAAADLGARAAEIRFTPSLGLLLAQECAELGRWVEALGHAERCAREAAAPAVARGPEIVAACAGVSRRAEAAVGRLTVRVALPAEGVRIEVGGRALAAALWNVPLPLLPGRVPVSARSADGRRFEGAAVVTAGGRAELRVTFPAARVAQATRSWGAGPWILAGAGAAGAATAAVLWSLRTSAIGERDDACDASGCDPSALAHDARADDLARGAGAALAVGATAVLGAGAWFVFGGRPSAPRAAVTLGPGGGVLLVGGAL